jgi:hypothetical protein
MTTEEREIQHLREFRSELADPSAERLARIRARLTGRAAPKERTRWSLRNLMVPAVAAAAVLTVAIASAVIAFDGDPGGSAPGAPPSEEPQDSRKTDSNPDMPGATAHRNAVTLLEQFAAAAGAGPAPLTVPAGQLLYVRGTGAARNASVGVDGSSPTTSKEQTYAHEMWVDVNGSIPVMIRRTDDGQVTVLAPDPNNPKDNHEASVAEQRQELATKGPSLRLPTPEYLAALPTDTEAMSALLRTLSPENGSWSEDHAIVDGLRQFLYTNEPLLTPQVRAALYRAMAKLESISSTGQIVEVDGRKLYAIAQTERDQRQELLLDAQTGRIVGGRSMMANETTPGFYDLWTHAVVAKAGDTP